MVTGGTYLKQHFFTSRQKLDLLRDALLELSESYRWHLEAWCVFSNHYHFVGVPSDGTNLT